MRGGGPLQTSGVRVLVTLAVSLSACGQPYELRPEERRPMGRLVEGVVSCAALDQCPTTAGACFVFTDERAWCAPAARGACEAIECATPSTCWCERGALPRCGCVTSVPIPY